MCLKYAGESWKSLDLQAFYNYTLWESVITPIVGVCNCSMFCCTLLYVLSSIAIILMGKRELVALLKLFSWCLVVVGRLFPAVPRSCLWFVIVAFADHTHPLFFLQLDISTLSSFNCFNCQSAVFCKLYENLRC